MDFDELILEKMVKVHGERINMGGGWIDKVYSISLLEHQNDTNKQQEQFERSSPEYLEWRKNVLKRNNSCVICGGNKKLEAHHIYGYKKYPALRTDPDNGITLCKFCHNKYHSYHGTKDITPNKFITFLKRFGLK